MHTYPTGIRAKCIPLIEDNQDLRGIVKLALEEKDYEVVDADDAETGIKRMQNARVDLAIFDIFMRGHGGI